MKTNSLDGVRILVVEDNRMIAENVAGALTYAGADIVGLIGDLEEAIGFVERRHQEINIALLDIDLSGAMSYPVADLLTRHNVPFVFTTGYDYASLHTAYRSFPVCTKPFNFDTIVSAILDLLNSDKTAKHF